MLLVFLTLKLFDSGCKKPRQITPHEAPPKLQNPVKGLKKDGGCLLASIRKCQRQDRVFRKWKDTHKNIHSSTSQNYDKEPLTYLCEHEAKTLNYGIYVLPIAAI